MEGTDPKEENMRIDVHAHCYPDFYVRELSKFAQWKEGGIGVEIAEWPGTEEMIADMDEFGVDVQVLSLSAPNVYFSDDGLSNGLAQRTNDFLADIAEKYPDRFLSLAAIPLTNLDYAMAELARAIDKLKMSGVMLGTNINGVPLSDNRFLPFFEEVNRKKIPVVLHPIKSAIESMMPESDVPLGLANGVGFLFETTRTFARFVLNGTFEKFPDLTFILPHSGGAIPFCAPRWDMFYGTRPETHLLKKTISHPPTYYLKRHYYDTALAYTHATLRCTLDLAGVDHLVFGTDYPYTAHDFRSKDNIKCIESYGFTADEKEKVFFQNALILFPKLKSVERSRKSR